MPSSLRDLPEAELQRCVTLLSLACMSGTAGLWLVEGVRFGALTVEPIAMVATPGPQVRVTGRQATLHRPDGTLRGVLMLGEHAAADARTQALLVGGGAQIIETLERHRALALAEFSRALLQQAVGVESVAKGLAQCLELVCDLLDWPVGHALLAEDTFPHSSHIWRRRPDAGFQTLVDVSRTLDFPPTFGIPSIIGASQTPHWIEDVRTDPRFVRGRSGDLGVRGYFGVPLVSQGRLFGVLEFFAQTPQPLQPDLLAVVAAVAPHMGHALHLQGTNAALQASEALKSAMLASALDCIIAADEDSRVLEFNAAAERTFGWTREEMLGRTLDDTIIPPEHRDAHKVGMARYLATGEHHVLGRRIEIKGMRKNGEVFPVELAIVENPGPTRRFTAFLRDLTQQRGLEEQLRESQRLDAMGRLAGGIAHDFNNILAAILGFAGFLLETTPPDDPRRPDVEAIQVAGERGAGLIKQLLIFSRKEVLAPQPVDVNDAVRELERLLQRTLGEDVVLEADLTPELRGVLIDPGQLQRVLTNLVVNARDAMPHGGRILLRTAATTLAAEDAELHGIAAPGEYVTLSVADTGTGMAPEVQCHIFEPFFTTKVRGHGTGLGLSMVYGIIHQAGGTVTVDSELEHGTVFRIYLPALPEIVQAAPPPEEFAPRPGRGEVILVAEDEDPVREVVQRVLQGHGFQVLAAGSMQEALAVAVPGQRIDLLLSDVVMPQGSGPELEEKLLEHRPGLRVLYMSGYADDLLQRRGPSAAPRDLLAKPFTTLALLRRVVAALDG
jgi:PAS domain S-box-containing protein